MPNHEELINKFIRLCEHKPEEEVVPAIVEILCLAMMVYDVPKTSLMAYIANEFDEIETKRKEWRDGRDA